MPLVTTLANTSARGYGGLKTFGVPSSYYSIETATVDSGGAASIEFTSIPSTYTHLQIRGIARDARTGVIGDYMDMQFNSDTGTNYSWHYVVGDGSVSAAAGTSQSSISCYPVATASASSNVFGTFVIDILDYTNTNKYKTTRMLSGISNNGSGAETIWFFSGNWRNTNAITSIKLTPGTPNFSQYTQFALYGIKA